MKLRALFAGLVAIVLAAGTIPVLAVEAVPKIQLAILLDTSNSMDGLISQAKSQLWKVVNECGKYRIQGVTPLFEVALYEYGKATLSHESGYIRQILPFTSDLDAIAAELFGLTTNGGEEYCGQVIHRAVVDLQWGDVNRDLMMIYIAGNEPFTQGPLDYHLSSASAIRRGIAVNTIHCGEDRLGIETGWRDGAVLASGVYASLKQDQAVVASSTPFDDEIVKLGTELNRTYIPYGRLGHANRARQLANDRRASSAVAIDSAVERQIAKAGANYLNESWDLVDAVHSAKVKLAEIEAKLLPESMQSMSPQERVEYLQAKAEQRRELQTKIAELQRERDEYLNKERMKEKQPVDKSLDQLILDGLRVRAKEKGFERTP